MIRPLHALNFGGKMLAAACVVNVWVSVYLAWHGQWLSLFPMTMAAFCGISTYNKKYQYQDHKDINEGREK